MQKPFVISGRDSCNSYDLPCMTYDKQSNIWTLIAAMLEGRENAACTVFEGKIVVSGGCSKRYLHVTPMSRCVAVRNYYDEKLLKTTEAYDYHEKKLPAFPRMLLRRANHTAVSISKKIFVIGGYFNHSSNNCEVFDSVT